MTKEQIETKIYLVSAIVQRDNTLGHRAYVGIGSRANVLCAAMDAFQVDDYKVTSHAIDRCVRLEDAIAIVHLEGEAKARVQGLNEAAALCRDKADNHGWNYDLPSVGRSLEAEILALKDKS